MASETKRILEHFDWIAEQLGEDLSWYIVYEAALKAGDMLHVEGSYDLPDNKRRLYNYATSIELCRLLEKHVLIGEKVDITHEFYIEAMDYFALHVPAVPTFELSGYLNYLDSWSMQFTDWTSAHPQPFENLEIVVSTC